MARFDNKFNNNDFRREELLRMIGQAINELSLEELESLYYDMNTKNFIKDRL